ncbi:MAG: hypothetical protein HXY41_05435 [Chloroflexi bacterium]|nr:hypothetical protein [Chloroflexota bacterium]
MLEADPVLGAVIATYPVDRTRLLLPAVALVVLVGTALNFTLAEAPGWGPPVTAGLTALVALAAGWAVLHLWNREIILYQNGFSYREGSRVVFFHYAEIRSIRQRAEVYAYFGGLLRRTVHRLTLTTIQEQRIVVGGLYRRVGDMGMRLENHILREIAPAVRDRLAKGQRVPFSDTLHLSADGLHEGGRDLPWADFGDYRTSGGRLALLTAGGEVWFSLPLEAVDNVMLLIGLLREKKAPA